MGVIGVLLVAAGVTGILRARRKPAAKGAADEADGERRRTTPAWRRDGERFRRAGRAG